MSKHKFIVADVLEGLRRLPDESVQCCVTSPPYWGLRNYGVDGQLGLEDTPEAYVERMVEVFREVRRVLRQDGTLWLNLGDSYAGSGKSRNGDGVVHNIDPETKQATNHGAVDGVLPKGFSANGIKPKDLVGIPWRVAFTLQTDGWWLRSDIIWAKPGPMPESVTDRPTRSHEYIFLLTKSRKYYYDIEAIKEPVAESSIKRVNQKTFDQQTGGEKDYGPNSNRSMRKTVENFAATIKKQDAVGNPTYTGFNGRYFSQPQGPKRNKRDVWFVSTKPYKGAHFAVFPEALVEPCILAGTSEAGCCPKCGAPWVRIVTRGEPILAAWSAKGAGQYDDAIGGMRRTSLEAGSTLKHITPISTVGWQPTCSCGLETIPCTVLDPFGGSGTVAMVCDRHNRNSVYIDLNPEYAQMAVARLKEDRAKRKSVKVS